MPVPDQLVVGTFNLFNLVLPEQRYYGKRTYDKGTYAQKVLWINQQLDKMKADIVGFQEVFHEEALRSVLKENPLYVNAEVLVAGDGTRSPKVALVSRFPIESYEVFEDFTEQLDVDGLVIPFKKFSRPVLKADVRIAKGLVVTVFVAHLKSKRPMFPEGVDRENPVELSKAIARSLLLRSAEANALRTLMLDTLEYRERPVIVLGDFNDTHTAVTTRLISGEAPPRYWKLKSKKRVWDTLLYHTKDIQARQSSRDVYFTHIYNGHYESLDHIMVSQELVRENPRHIGNVRFVRTFNDHLIDETLSEQRVNEWESDHGQVVAYIDLVHQ